MAPRSRPAEQVDETPAPLVQARFVDVQAVYTPSQGVITYGDPIWVTGEQLDQDVRFVPWSDDWTPDPALEAAAGLEG